MNALTFINRCRSIFSDNAGVRREGAKNSGPFIDEGRLGMLAVSDLRVFAKRVNRTFKDWGIHLLVDCSGSMQNGGRIEPCIDAVWALLDALRKAGVGSVTVSGFNQILHPMDKPTQNSRGALTKVLREACAMSPDSNGHGGNHDGYAVRQAVRAMQKSREAGKVLLVFSDGRPTCDDAVCGHPGCNRSDTWMQEDLQSAVKEARRAGIATLGVGISAEHVKQFYGEPHSTSVNNLDELFTKTAALLERHIVRG